MTYAILYHPGHNRVYFEASLELSLSELHIASQKLSSGCDDIQLQTICGIEYLTFHTEKLLTRQDISIIYGLSFVYALFLLEYSNDKLYFNPVERIKQDFIDSSMSSILRYTGKTNETFTRMLLNIAFYSGNSTGQIRLLDPIAGKGTTLYEGLIRGYDAYGIEIGDSAVNEAYHFVRKFLETAKYKFECSSIKFSGTNKSFTALRHTFKTAATKADFKSKNTKTLELISGNSIYANKYYKKNFFDIIAGDLPYGVQHGNVTNEKQSSLTRNPTELLKACLPSWIEVLKPTGIIALSWNSNVLRRSNLESLFAQHGLIVKDDLPYLHLAHRVDRSILRDIIVAQKP